MVWNLEAQGQVLLWLAVPDEFLDWLRPHVRDAMVAGLDPYRDATLDRSAQERWLSELRRVAAALDSEARARIQATERLPRDRQEAQRIQDTLVGRELARQPWWSLLGELTSALELALDSAAVIRARGD